jgi:hypothetical protein
MIVATEIYPRPLPCSHDRKGERHRSLAQLLRCIDKYGVPGFGVRDVRSIP